MAEVLHNPLGIIAGAGRFPFMVAEGARPVVIVGLKGLADPALKEYADRFRWSGVVRLGKWIRFFRRFRVHEAIMAGSVRKTEMYGRFRMIRYLPDWTSIKLWFFEVATAATEIYTKKKGITLGNSVQYCGEHLAQPGVLGRQQPNRGQWEDIEFGWSIAKQMGQLDIGQSIAVKEREVIAVEAIEGTDRMIERAGQLCPRGGWSLIKVAKPDQDPRFDVPTVGPDTIENMQRNGAKALVIEAGQTLVVNREELICKADRWGITVVAHDSDAPPVIETAEEA